MRIPHALGFTLAVLFAGWAGPVFSQSAATPKGPERWEPDFAKFAAQDQATPPPKDAILFIGSSSIRMWKLETSFPDRVVLNRGFGGSTLADSIHFFDRLVPPYRPKAVVIYAGDNDVSKGMTAAEVAADFEKLAGLCAEKVPGTPVIFLAIKPSIKRWNLWPVQRAANEAIAAWCAGREGFFFADVATPMLADVPAGDPPKADWFIKDGLHLSPEGYARWKAVLDPLLDGALAKP